MSREASVPEVKLKTELEEMERENREGEPCWSVHELAAATAGVSKKSLFNGAIKAGLKCGMKGVEMSRFFDGRAVTGYEDFLLTAPMVLAAYQAVGRRTVGSIPVMQFFEERLALDSESDDS